jgi:hypothetical protein
MTAFAIAMFGTTYLFLALGELPGFFLLAQPCLGRA